MQLELLKSKIHRARITGADLDYIGSITIDEDLMNAAHLLEYEKVLVVNNNNGARFETYVIKGVRGSGSVFLNGATARLALPGDIVIIMAFISLAPEEAKIHIPIAVFPDENNKIGVLIELTD